MAQGVPIEIYMEVHRRDKGKCVCGANANDLAHIIPPRSRFGKEQKDIDGLCHRKENIVELCSSCHQFSHTRRGRAILLHYMHMKFGYTYSDIRFTGEMALVDEREVPWKKGIGSSLEIPKAIVSKGREPSIVMRYHNK